MTYSYRKAEQTEKEAPFKLYCLAMRGYISEIGGWNDQWQENDFSTHFNPNGITLVHEEGELVGYFHVENWGGQLFEEALRHAIKDDLGLAALYYQPVVDIHSYRVVSLEALARWNSAEFGPASPVRLIPVAEETALIVEVGDWVLTTVMLTNPCLARRRIR